MNIGPLSHNRVPSRKLGPFLQFRVSLGGSYGSHLRSCGSHPGKRCKTGNVQGVNRVSAPSPSLTSGVPLTTLRSFSEIGNREIWLSASILNALSMLDDDTSKLG